MKWAGCFSQGFATDKVDTMTYQEDITLSINLKFRTSNQRLNILVDMIQVGVGGILQSEKKIS